MSKPWHNADTLRRLYWDDGLSLSEIADELDCSRGTIHYNMKKHGIPRRTPDNKKPPHYYTHPFGYELWQSRVDGDLKTVRVHVLAAIAWFGYQNVVGKDIHHTNRVPWDNREDNLEPITHVEHTELHNEDRDMSEVASERWDA